MDGTQTLVFLKRSIKTMSKSTLFLFVLLFGIESYADIKVHSEENISIFVEQDLVNEYHDYIYEVSAYEISFFIINNIYSELPSHILEELSKKTIGINF